MIVLFIFRSALVKWLAPGFLGEIEAQAARLISITLTMVPLQSAQCVLTGYWIARERVLLPSLTLLLGNAVVIVLAGVIGSSLTAETIAWITVIGAFVVFIALCIAFIWERTEEGTFEKGSLAVAFSIFRLSLPLVASGLIGRASPLIERNLASSMGLGTISCLGYAAYAVTFLVNVTTSPTATAYYATICKHWNEGRIDELRNFIGKGSVMVLASSLVIVGYIVLCTSSALSLALPHSKFDSSSIKQLSEYITILMVAYVFLSLSSFMARIFYAANKFWYAAFIDFVVIACYVIVAPWLAGLYLGYGLVIAGCINGVLMLLLILIGLRRVLNITLPWRVWKVLVMILLAWGVNMVIVCLLRQRSESVIGTPAAVAGVTILYSIGLLPIVAGVLRSVGLEWKGLLQRLLSRCKPEVSL
jgi:peptidoglycan biosynthesis protein MviN/MurJ (putative lipid II flippase)